jgi:hypothetical protein
LEIISPDTSTNAVVKINYELNWIEITAVMAQIVDPGEQLKSAIEANTGKTVTDVSVSDGHIECTIKDFLYQENGVTTIPSLTFERAEKILKGYWFASVLTIDLAPDITNIIFSDGHTISYKKVLVIPETSYTVPK